MDQCMELCHRLVHNFTSMNTGLIIGGCLKFYLVITLKQVLICQPTIDQFH